MKTKRILLLFLSLILAFGICLAATSCGDEPTECTEHIDENGDGICDDCGASAPTAHVHSDMNADYKCDGCKTDLTPPEHDCVDENEDLECDICGEEVDPPKHTHADENEDEVCDECGADMSLNLDGITVTKTSSHDRIRTVHPGEKITYTFTVTSTADKDKRVEILETLPGITAYVSGDCEKQGNRLVFNVTATAGKTVTVSYTVQVPDSSTLKGSAISSGTTMANGKAIDSSTLYVGNTYNEHDMQRLVLALYATRGSDFDAKDVLSSHQRIAFSLTSGITHNADGVATAIFLDTTAENADKYASMVIPGLYGGTKIDDTHTARFVGSATSMLEIEDIFPGDVLLVLPHSGDVDGAKMYVTDGTRLFDITNKSAEVSVDSVLSDIASNDYFALLRPSMASNSVVFFRANELYEGTTDIERAIINTALAFLIRGDRMQYADIRLVQSPAIYRWERGKSPEDYTLGETGYSNCTGFVHDVFLNALGYDYGSFTLANAPAAMKAYTYYFTGEETDREKAELEAEYRSLLRVGDIVFYTYSGNTHAMVYIGNGNLVHATGNTYSNYTEAEEPTVRFLNLDCLFTEGNSRYLFQTDKPRTALYIIRPLDTWGGTELPETTVNRLENMNGIIAEKLASYTLGQTVNRGDLITYTFKIFNTNSYPVSLTVYDVVPTGTTLMIDGVASTDTQLSWSVTVAPGEEVLVSYTVKVSDTAARGSAIYCSDNSTVGGVPVRITPAYVGNTLTAEEQARLVEIVNTAKSSGKTGVALANLIYEELLGVEDILGYDVEDLRDGLFTKFASNFKIATEGKYADMIAPSLFGGKVVNDTDRFDGERTRMPRERNLIVGDILFLQSDTSGYLYIYIGNGEMIDLQKLTVRDVDERLEETIGWQRFAIIRPSLAIEE